MRVILLIIFVFSFLGFQYAFAQIPKLGYTNIELIVSLMPEAQQMDATLRTHEQKLMEQVNVKKQYLEVKIQEYTEKKNSGKLVGAQEETERNDIIKLEGEIKKFVEDAELNFNKKKEELLNPILDKLQVAIDDVAAEEGYEYVFNSGLAGSSILLKGPKQHNITIKVLKKLNVDVPKELEEQLNSSN